MSYSKIFAFSCSGIDDKLVENWFVGAKQSAIESGFTKFELQKISSANNKIYKIITEADNIESMVELSFQLGIGVMALINSLNKGLQKSFQINTDLFR